MSRSFREIYQSLREEINIPPKKLGPGTGQAGQHTVGNQTVQLKTHDEFINNTKTYSGMQSAITRPLNTDVKTEPKKPAPALDTQRNSNLDRPNEKSPMAAAQNRAALSDKVKAGRVGTNTFVSGARQEAQRRRESGKPVLQAKDVPGLNKSPEAVKAAQSRSDEIMKNADRQKSNIISATPKTSMSGGSGDYRNAQKKPSGAQAATPPTKTAPAAPAQSWSQKVGSAMKAHIRKGGKVGDTIDVEGKKIKVAWKDGKVYK